MFDEQIGNVVVKEFYGKKVPSNGDLKYDNWSRQRLPFKVFGDSVVFSMNLVVCEQPNNVYILNGVKRRDRKVEKYLIQKEPCHVTIKIPLLDILDNKTHKLFNFYIKEEYRQDILGYLMGLISERRKRPHDPDIFELRNSAFVVEYLTELYLKVQHNNTLFVIHISDHDEDDIQLIDPEM